MRFTLVVLLLGYVLVVAGEVVLVVMALGSDDPFRWIALVFATLIVGGFSPMAVAAVRALRSPPPGGASGR
ncbi:hypothetical protein ACFYT4_03545 [Streptomyces sp. NPDC004609]|uniref:hypothetical protein n=1 Tax=Streptomyces sp. NPDC004609 TaxID=3364704 RepID=UPI0036BF6860